MLELKINHKGTDKYFYGRDIEAVALESFELFNNDEQANEYIQNDRYEDYIKDFLNGEYYVEYDKGAYRISEQLTELAEQFLYE